MLRVVASCIWYPSRKYSGSSAIPSILKCSPRPLALFTSSCMQTVLNVGDRLLRTLTTVIIFKRILTRSLIWKVKFKKSKCVLIRFCRTEPCVEYIYTINNNIIHTRENHRDLGVMVSSHLSWQSHHNHIAVKTYRILGLLCRTFSAVDSVTEKNILNIRSHLLYHSPTWRLQLIKDIARLEISNAEQASAC